MFDPTSMLANGRFGYVMCHTGRDYTRKVPWRIRLNPLRWQIGIGRSRPCAIVINKGGWMHRAVSNLLFRIRGRP